MRSQLSSECTLSLRHRHKTTATIVAAARYREPPRLVDIGRDGESPREHQEPQKSQRHQGIRVGRRVRPHCRRASQPDSQPESCREREGGADPNKR